MSISKTVTNRPTTVLIIFSIIIGLGAYIVPQIPVDLYPEITPPYLMIYTSYEGAGPEEVEQNLTRILEGQLVNVSDIKEVTSTSSEGSSMVMMEFGWETSLTDAANDVRDKLEFVKDYLPEDAKSPQIFKFDPSMMPILMLAVEGNRSPEETREIAEDQIQSQIEQIPGVASTSLTGGRTKIIRVEISQNRLEAYNLSLTMVARTISLQNMQIGAGSIDEGSKTYLIRTQGEFKSLEQIENVIIKTVHSDGNTKEIRLKDIAKVTEDYKDPTSTVYINGKPGVYLSVMKQSGTNSVATADAVLAKLPKINQNTPPDMKISVIQNTTSVVKNSLNQVGQSALTGALLAMLVLLIFLRSFKSTIIIGLSIPISLLITVMCMYFAGMTLNMMTLAGLTLGVGMIVDSSIVILENIFRYRAKGAKLKPSAVLGAQEMITPIVASTLTTIFVFLPVIMFKKELEMIGVLFQDLAFTIVISLVSSLFVSLTLVPVLASRYLPIYTRTQVPLQNPLLKFFDNNLGKLFDGMERGYKKILEACLNHRISTLIIMVLIFISSLLMFPSIGINFMPTAEEDSIKLDMTLPIGTKLEITDQYMSQLSELTKENVKSIKDMVITSGSSGGMFMGSEQSNLGSITLNLKDFDQRTESNDEIKEILRTFFDLFPAATFKFSSANQMGGSASPIDILVKSDDLDKAKFTARQIKEIIQAEAPEVTEPDVSFRDGLPQIEVEIDRPKAYSLGLSVYDIANEISANIDGKTASRYRVNGDEYDIMVILNEKDRTKTLDMEKIFIMNPQGQKIPLSSMASLVKTAGPVDIAREDQTRVVHVTGGLKPGQSSSVVEPKIQKLISENIIADEAIQIEFSGDFAEIQSYGIKFAGIMLIAVILVFGVMASQFESLKDPFIIFLTMPLMFIGIIWIYKLTGEAISMFSAVGIVMLAGIVVNNGIVLVDYTNLLRERGLTIKEACIAAGGNRLRPVLMTSLTTILGMLPMAFFPGEGSELVKPLGQTVVGGMTVSTIMTLFLAPVLYSLFNRKHKKSIENLEGSLPKESELEGDIQE